MYCGEDSPALGKLINLKGNRSKTAVFPAGNLPVGARAAADLVAGESEQGKELFAALQRSYLPNSSSLEQDEGLVDPTTTQCQSVVSGHRDSV
jgi:hypothetical protein